MIARLENASKKYKSGDTEITALQPTDFAVQSGELVLIMGPSGSGKTTLLSLLGCVIYPSTGSVWMNNNNVTGLGDVALAKIRLNNIGFVFQSFNLIAPLTVLQNVMIPLILQNKSERSAKEEALKLLEQLGLLHRLDSLPKTLSGGEQQRVSIARALATDPPLILCDEPTASLDVKSAEIVMNQLQNLAKEGKSVVVVSHDLRLVPYATRLIEVTDGAIQEANLKEYIQQNKH